MMKNNSFAMKNNTFAMKITGLFVLAIMLASLLPAVSATTVAGTTTQQLNNEFGITTGQTVNVPIPAREGGSFTISLSATNVYKPGPLEDAMASATFEYTGPEPGENASFTLLENQEKLFGSLKVKLNRIELDGETAVAYLVVSIIEDTDENPPSVFVPLNEQFTLMLRQTANVENENLELTLLSVLYPSQPPCEAGQACPAIYVAPYAKIRVTKTSGDSATSTELLVSIGRNPEVFGYTIETLSVTPSEAQFRITKQSEPPASIRAQLGERFSLKTSQTASVVKNNETTVKVTLHKISEQQVYCITAPCPTLKTAYVGFSFPEGSGMGFSISEKQTLSINKNLEIQALEIGSTSAVFVVREKEAPGDAISVQFDEEFQLKQNQTAVVQETGFKIQFVKYRSDCKEEKCFNSAVFLVSPAWQNAPAVENSGTSNSRSPGSTGAQKLISTYNPYITLREGESETVFGHTVHFDSLNYREAQFGTGIATLWISREETQPGEDTAVLNEKFKLKTGQSTEIVEYAGSNRAIAKVNLQSIDFVYCTQEVGTKCDSRPVVQLWMQPFSQSQPTLLKLREGESRTVGEYSIFVLDVPSDGYAVLLVKKAFDSGYIKVALDQKFSLLTGQTAFVTNAELFLKLEYLSQTKRIPPQTTASVSVWKNAQAYEKRGSSESENRPIAVYNITQGDSIELYGYTISFVEGAETKGVFVVSGKPDSSVIRVNTNEPFWLNVGQAAKVLQANIRLDLLRITPGICVDATQPGEDASETRPCSETFVTIGVNSVLGKESDTGKVLVPTLVQEAATVESVAITGNAILPSIGYIQDIEVPPTPFQVFELTEGKEVTINQFTIKVLSITGDRAEFIVREKPSNQKVSYEISPGWNLFSLPGELEAERNNCDASTWKVFEYNQETTKFDRVTKPVPGHAYWVYNPGEQCRISASIRNPVSMRDLATIMPKWNFVPITVDMVGHKINALGDCKIRAAFEWNANSRQWQKTTTQEISREDLGKAWAVYSANKCRLDAEGDLTPPELPSVDEEPTSNVRLVELNQDFELEINQEAEVKGENLTLMFGLHAPECREPTEACYQRGVFVAYDGRKEERFKFEMNTEKVVTIGNYQVQLNSIRGSGDKAVANLKITR